MSFTEHRVLFLVYVASLPREQIHNLSDFLAELSKPLHDIVFIGKLVQNLLDHFSQLVKKPIFEIDQILSISFVWHL